MFISVSVPRWVRSGSGSNIHGSPLTELSSLVQNVDYDTWPINSRVVLISELSRGRVKSFLVSPSRGSSRGYTQAKGDEDGGSGIGVVLVGFFDCEGGNCFYELG